MLRDHSGIDIQKARSHPVPTIFPAMSRDCIAIPLMIQCPLQGAFECCRRALDENTKRWRCHHLACSSDVSGQHRATTRESFQDHVRAAFLFACKAKKIRSAVPGRKLFVGESPDEPYIILKIETSYLRCQTRPIRAVAHYKQQQVRPLWPQACHPFN